VRNCRSQIRCALRCSTVICRVSQPSVIESIGPGSSQQDRRRRVEAKQVARRCKLIAALITAPQPLNHFRHLFLCMQPCTSLPCPFPLFPTIRSSSSPSFSLPPSLPPSPLPSQSPPVVLPLPPFPFSCFPFNFLRFQFSMCTFSLGLVFCVFFC